jgi:hypothetical protein
MPAAQGDKRMKIPSIAAALALVTACAVQTPAEVQTAAVVPGEYVKGEAAAPAPLATCRIRETPTANGLRLEAIVTADHAVYGDYEFTVTAQGRAGSSDVSQGGRVELASGERATVGSAEFSGGRYRALLTLTDADGALCTAERLS